MEIPGIMLAVLASVGPARNPASHALHGQRLSKRIDTDEHEVHSTRHRRGLRIRSLGSEMA